LQGRGGFQARSRGVSSGPLIRAEKAKKLEEEKKNGFGFKKLQKKFQKEPSMQN
jgi:hypothetical protein